MFVIRLNVLIFVKSLEWWLTLGKDFVFVK